MEHRIERNKPATSVQIYEEGRSIYYGYIPGNYAVYGKAQLSFSTDHFGQILHGEDHMEASLWFTQEQLEEMIEKAQKLLEVMREQTP